LIAKAFDVIQSNSWLALRPALWRIRRLHTLLGLTYLVSKSLQIFADTSLRAVRVWIDSAT
jgi:hypothetical protein